jgi:acetyl-CoA carboxylase alpha subunit
MYSAKTSRSLRPARVQDVDVAVAGVVVGEGTDGGVLAASATD